MNHRICMAAILFVLTFHQLALAQGNTQSGAVIGGLGGAGIGAIIGDHNDKAGAGAIIGGAVGTLAGSILGNSKDQQMAYNNRVYQQHQAQLMARAVSVSDVVALTHNRLSDAVIINTVQANGLQRPLEISDIVYLSQQGVSENVIRAMQDIGSRRAMAPPMVVEPVAPVMVSRVHVIPEPVYFGPPQPSFYFNYSRHYRPSYPRCR